MLDTVKLCIPVENSIINTPTVFCPAISGGIRKNVKYICNPDKYWTKQGVYQPKITLIKGYDNITNLFIEFSAPKLIFGNNFDELQLSEFEQVIEQLKDRLIIQDIEISEEILRKAKISSIHYSKNIKLRNIQCIDLIEIISKLDISKRYDICRSDYKNGGQIVRFHTDIFEIAFYDKVSDLKQSNSGEKRAFERENWTQKDLINQLAGVEVFRIEVRLNKAKKIRKILEQCNIDSNNITFEQLFNPDISKKIISHCWDKYIEKSIYIVCQSSTDTNIIFSKCILAGFSIPKALKIVGLLANIKESGCRHVKEIIKQATFTRYAKDIALLELDDNYILKKFREVRNQIKSTLPLRINNILNREVTA